MKSRIDIRQAMLQSKPGTSVRRSFGGKTTPRRKSSNFLQTFFGAKGGDTDSMDVEENETVPMEIEHHEIPSDKDPEGLDFFETGPASEYVKGKPGGNFKNDGEIEDALFESNADCSYPQKWQCGLVGVQKSDKQPRKLKHKANTPRNAGTSIWILEQDSHEEFSLLLKAIHEIDYRAFLEQMKMSQRISEAGICPRLKQWYYSVSDNTGIVIMILYPENVMDFFTREKEFPDWLVNNYDECLVKMADIGICCTDLKPQNVVVDQKTQSVKLIDFGEGATYSFDAKDEKLKQYALAYMRFISRLFFYFFCRTDLYESEKTLQTIPEKEVFQQAGKLFNEDLTFNLILKYAESIEDRYQMNTFKYVQTYSAWKVGKAEGKTLDLETTFPILKEP